MLGSQFIFGFQSKELQRNLSDEIQSTKGTSLYNKKQPNSHPQHHSHSTISNTNTMSIDSKFCYIWLRVHDIDQRQ